MTKLQSHVGTLVLLEMMMSGLSRAGASAIAAPHWPSNSPISAARYICRPIRTEEQISFKCDGFTRKTSCAFTHEVNPRCFVFTSYAL